MLVQSFGFGSHQRDVLLRDSEDDLVPLIAFAPFQAHYQDNRVQQPKHIDDRRHPC